MLTKNLVLLIYFDCPMTEVLFGFVLIFDVLALIWRSNDNTKNLAYCSIFCREERNMNGVRWSCYKSTNNHRWNIRFLTHFLFKFYHMRCLQPSAVSYQILLHSCLFPSYFRFCQNVSRTDQNEEIWGAFFLTLFAILSSQTRTRMISVSKEQWE